MAGFLMRDLSGYLATAIRRRFAFGELDCCTFMADWLVARGFSDPMADRRGTYATEAEYRAAMRSEGGIFRSCSQRFTAVGLRETDHAVPGDVCLVKVPVSVRGRVVRGMTGAICVTDKLRAVVTPDAGLVIAGVPIVSAWHG
jgi:hypothetical protein